MNNSSRHAKTPKFPPKFMRGALRAQSSRHSFTADGSLIKNGCDRVYTPARKLSVYLTASFIHREIFAHRRAAASALCMMMIKKKEKINKRKKPPRFPRHKRLIKIVRYISFDIQNKKKRKKKKRKKNARTGGSNLFASLFELKRVRVSNSL